MKIIPYSPNHKKVFYDLNVAWLENYFYVESYDRKVLSHPEKYIIAPGGHIFFAIEKGQAIGTFALLKRENGVFELTKMAVNINERGKGIGKKLLQYCIDFAQKKDFKGLFLYSNTKLENAIYLYRKFGFKEVSLETKNPYERANIKMVYPL